MKKMNWNRIKIFSLTIFVLLNVALTFGQTNRGAGNVKIKTENGQTKEIKIYDGSYALIIGESNYTNGWDNLPGVKTDVSEVRAALERQGFAVETEINLTSDNFKARVDRFIGDYGYQKNNRLLIYFAGHGHTQKSADGRDLGYIVPVDAPLPERDELGFRRKAVSMDTIQAYARQIEAKHALFVFDSCFSGKLISRDKITIPPVIEENFVYPVRQFITAAAANQCVPDDSVFRKAFVRGLDGEADRNSDGYIMGSELADYLKEKVTNSTDRTQTPQYGKIRDIELNRGDIVFISKKKVNEPTVTIFDVVENFSQTTNPNDSWGYGYMLKADNPDPSTFNYFTQQGTHYSNFSGKSSPGIYSWRYPLLPDTPIPNDFGLWVMKNITNNTVEILQPKQVAILPGVDGTFCAVRWIAPDKGNIKLSAQFGGVQDGTTTKVFIFLNNKMLFADKVSGKTELPIYNSERIVEKDDTIDFIVGYGDDREPWGDETSLTAKIIFSR